jgi:DNA primase
MNKKTQNKYFNIFINQANKWLYKDIAKKEYLYLCDRIPKDYINLWQFGYMPNSHEYLIEFIDEFGKSINEDPQSILKELGIVYDYYKRLRSFFHNNTLLIPMFDVYGQPVTISGRTMESEKFQKENGINKYKHLSYSKKNNLFGLNNSYKEIIKNKCVVIVEGQFDCISGFNCGIKNIVALSGNKLTFEQIVLLKRFSNHFMLLLDNDEGGNLGFEKAKKQAVSYNFKLSKLSVPFGKDLNQYIIDAKIVSLNDLIV